MRKADQTPLTSRRLAKSASRPLPTSIAEWLVEIALAWMDAAESKPHGPKAVVKITDALMFHLAPMVALKFRGKKLTGKKAEDITKTALANYVVNTAHDTRTKGVSAQPKMSFALVYVAAHFAMDLVTEDMAHEILACCEATLESGLN